MASPKSGMAQYGQRTLGQPQALTLDHVSPATRLLEKRRQMFEVQEALEAQKEEFARREDAFRRREEALRKKDLELQESLIKFNKFLQENESKRTRAVKRATDERKQRLQKDDDLKNLQDMLEEKTREENFLKEQLTKHLKYSVFLTEVVEAMSEEYPEVADLLNRYKTLYDANKDLSATQHNADQENEQQRNKLLNLQKERANEILNLNNQIAEKQQTLELSQTEVLRKQTHVESKIISASDVTLELGQILSSVENLLERCEDGHTKKRQTHVSLKEGKKAEKGNGSSLDLDKEREKAINRLDDIAMYMLDFIDICEDFKRDNHEDKLQKRSSVLVLPQMMSEMKS